MRISTSSFYEQTVSAIGQQQQKLFRIQQMQGTQTKFLTPADDPVGAARSLRVSESLSLTDQYATTRERAMLSLSREETALDGAVAVLQNIKALTVAAGNGTLSDADRQSLAITLQSDLDQLQSFANADDGNGQFLFAGYKSANAPFATQTDGSVKYVGDQGQRLMQVDAARQISTADDGRSVFMSVQGGAGYVTSSDAANTGSGVFGRVGLVDATDANYGKDFTISFSGGNYSVKTGDTPAAEVASGTFEPGTTISFAGLQISIAGNPADNDSFSVATAKNAGTNIFEAVGDLVSALRRPLEGGGDAARAQLANALSTANVKVTNAHDNVLTVRSSIGSRINELTSLNGAGEARELMDKAYLSSLRDLDPVEAISEFFQRQTALQATQLTFAKLSSIALFNYL